MATNSEHGTDAGSMNPSDMAEHVRTWKGFVRFMTWLVAGSVAVMGLLAIFRTHG